MEYPRDEQFRPQGALPSGIPRPLQWLLFLSYQKGGTYRRSKTEIKKKKKKKEKGNKKGETRTDSLIYKEMT